MSDGALVSQPCAVEAKGHDKMRQSDVSEKITTALADYLKRDPATI